MLIQGRIQIHLSLLPCCYSIWLKVKARMQFIFPLTRFATEKKTTHVSKISVRQELVVMCTFTHCILNTNKVSTKSLQLLKKSFKLFITTSLLRLKKEKYSKFKMAEITRINQGTRNS